MRRFGLYLIGFFFCGPAWPLESGLTLQQLSHKEWTEAEGLPSSVYAVAQTTDGTLWLGGLAGLARFDGIRFVAYPGPGEEPLLSSDISALIAAPAGGLWIGFRFGGVAFLRDGRLTRYGEREGVPAGTINALVWDPENVLWLAARGGLARLQGDRWERVAPESIPTAYGALFDRAGTLWVSTADHVLALPRNQDRFLQMGLSRGGLSVTELFAMSPDGHVWTWTADGLTRMKDPTGSGTEGNLTFHVRAAPPLFFDRAGNLWLGGDDIQRLSPEQLSDPLAVPETFTSSVLNGGAEYFLEDRENDIWAATHVRLDRFSHPNVVRTPVPPCNGAGYVPVPGDDGTLWAACMNVTSTSGFLLEIRHGTVVSRRETLNLTAGYRDSDGTVWFGSFVGVGRLESHGFVTTPLPEEARDHQVQAIARDRTGALWVSIVGKGMFRLSGGVWTAYGALDALPRLPAVAEAVDAQGTLWLGYIENRIARIQDDAVKLFDTSSGLAVGNVTAITAKGSHVWVGGELGLARFDGARFVPVRSASGRPFRGISGIIETRAGDLWLNGTAGIVHVSPREVEQVVRDPAHRVQLETLDYLDGVPGTALQIRPTPSAVETTDGRLWFSTTAGVVLVDPTRIVRNALPPPVKIWSISSGAVQYPIGDRNLHLPVHTRQLRVEYAANSLTIPERVRFKYKLEGSDTDWQDASNRREASYTNLAPGQYTFRVIASNNDGVWNTTGAATNFTIDPAFYQTKWFYALCALMFLAGLGGLYRLRIQQVSVQVRARLEERLAERERIARELHDTLLQGVQGLIFLFHVATDRIPPREPARELMERALDRADALLGESRSRVMDLRESSTTVELTQALALEGEFLATAHSAQFRARVEGETRELHPIVREEALLVGREALSNAFRHANARRIEAEVSYGQTELHVRVRDDGRGIDRALLHAGGRVGHWGLLGMRERARKLSGTLEIWSTKDAGTEIDLRVPAAVAYRILPRAGLHRWRYRKGHPTRLT